MHRLFLISGALVVVLLAAAVPEGWVQAEGPEPVFVTNLPDVQQIQGSVVVPEPVPHTLLVVKRAQVSPGGSSDEPTSYADAGIIDTSGFSSVSFALAGEVEGRVATPASVGALLVPDVPEILANLQTYGIKQFVAAVEAPVTTSPPGIFQSELVHYRIGFPSYRLFFYNGTTRTTDTVVYLYLSN